MLWTIFVILLVLWLLGIVTSYTMGGFNSRSIGFGRRCHGDSFDPGAKSDYLIRCVFGLAPERKLRQNI